MNNLITTILLEIIKCPPAEENINSPRFQPGANKDMHNFITTISLEIIKIPPADVKNNSPRFQPEAK